MGTRLKTLRHTRPLSTPFTHREILLNFHIFILKINLAKVALAQVDDVRSAVYIGDMKAPPVPPPAVLAPAKGRGKAD